MNQDRDKAYDLYKRDDEEGKNIWIETVIGLDDLKQRLEKLSSLKPGTYLVYDPTQAQFIEPFGESAS